MQLDKTRIAVRERGGIDTFDLTFQVLRAFAPRLVPALLIGIVPFAVLNYFLLSWMDEQVDVFEEGPPFRYLWNYTMLVFFQGPAATIFGVSYLGGAVFRHERTVAQVVRDVFSVFPGFLLCQLFLRGTLLATCMPLVYYRSDPNPLLEGFVFCMMGIYVAFMRALRPFINEIVVLERNPITAKGEHSMTVNRRSGFLHTPSGGDLFAQWLGAILVAVAMTNMLYWSFFTLQMVMIGNTNPLHPFCLHVLYPIAIWITVAYLGVARFLSYLDLRIRQEGWEVELLIKAESSRMAEKLV
jgi:hypothetical protein